MSEQAHVEEWIGGKLYKALELSVRTLISSLMTKEPW